MSPRGARSVAYVIASISIVLTAAAACFLIIDADRLGAGATIDANGTIGLILGLAFSVVGALVASRRPGNPIGWVYLAIGLSQGLNSFAWGYWAYGLAGGQGPLPLEALASWVKLWAWAPGLVLFGTISLLIFPDGHHLTPRWRIVSAAAMVSLALMVVPAAVAGWPAGIGAGAWSEVADVLQSVGVAIWFVATIASVASLILRWRRARGIEREQLKWLAFAVSVEIPLLLATLILPIDPVVGAIAALFIVPLIPVAIGIAVLRYRLYDIDRLISRTVSYGVVTVTLATVFAGVVLGLTAVLQSITGGNTVAVAASTLIVAALFQPLRGRVKRRVDRRFDRSRYDGQRTADAFAALMRDETDLDTIADDLTSVIERVLAPRDTTLWVTDRWTGSVTDQAVPAIP